MLLNKLMKKLEMTFSFITSDGEDEGSDISKDVVFDVFDEQVHVGVQVVDQGDAVATRTKYGRVVKLSTKYLKCPYVTLTESVKLEDFSEAIGHK